MRIILLYIAAFIILLAPMRAWAVHPFQVDETNTQGKGNVLFELNGDYLKDGAFKTDTVTGVFAVGASENTDFSLEAPYIMLDPSPSTGIYEQGGGDILLALKYRLFENEVKQSMGFRIYNVFATGDVNKGLGGDEYIVGFELMDQQECGNNILHASLGYESVGKDMIKFHLFDAYAFRFGLAAEHKITESFRFLMEFAGQNRRQMDEVTGERYFSLPLTALAGFRYDITRSWYVDLAGRKGLNKYAEDYSALAGVAWRF